MGRMLVQASNSVLAGTVTSMFRGITMVWYMYQLRSEIHKLAQGGEEGARQLRNIVNQLGGTKAVLLKIRIIWIGLTLFVITCDDF